jgi:hypothetical protein
VADGAKLDAEAEEVARSLWSTDKEHSEDN